MELQLIKVKDIIITKDNPRHIDTNSPDFLGLCDSIAATGIAIPIHVEKNGSGYILKAGERRLRAAKVLKLVTVPAIVYESETANGVMHLENYQRKNLTLFEQVKSINQLLKENTDPVWIANQFGVHENRAKQLIHVVNHLSPKWKELIQEETTGWETWTMSMIAFIAKHPKDVQDDLACTYSGEYNRRRCSLAELQEDVDEHKALLKSFPWPLDEKFSIAQYEEHGIKYMTHSICADCPNQTSNKDTALLFPELSEDKNPKCLSVNCNYVKMTQWMTSKIKELKEQYPNLIGVKPKSHIGINYDENVLFDGIKLRSLSWSCEQIKKGSKDAVPGIRTAGKSAGKLIWVKVTQDRDHILDAESKPAKKKASEKTYDEKMEGLTTKRWYGAITKVLATIDSLKLSNLSKDMQDAGLLYMAALLGITRNISNYDYRNSLSQWRKYLAIDDDLNEVQKKILWGDIKATILEMMKQDTVMANTSKAEIELCKSVCAEFGIGVKPIFDQVCTEKGFTIPKSWTK